MHGEWPMGHANHLTLDQEQSLQTFKTLCRELGCYSPSVDGSQPSHDDETLLRFLRARSFSAKDALVQFKKAEDWRQEQDIEDWYKTIDVSQYEMTRKLYTHWTGRRDKRGFPLYVFRISSIDEKAMANDSFPISGGNEKGGISLKLRRLFATYEHLTTFVMPLCSMIPSRPYPETPISQATCIVDIQGVGLLQFLRLKSHLQEASAMATAYYPETLGVTFIVGAPSFFPTVWKYIKRWFDPVTVNKIVVLSQSEVKSTLELSVADENIPSRYGGSLDWDFGQLPLLEPTILDLFGWKTPLKTIPMGPISLVRDVEGDVIEAHALGSINGVHRDEIIANIKVKSSNPRGVLNTQI